MNSNLYSQGSQWRRWDPHMHAPGTLFNDGFKGNWDEYRTRINNTPTLEVLGITDYFCVRTYEIVRHLHEKGEFPCVKMVFPNVELRLEIPTPEGHGINIHLLFSPEDPLHVEKIKEALSRLSWSFKERPYSCSIEGLTNLGKAYDPSLQVNDEAALKVGANQFKTTLTQLKDLFLHDRWMRENCMVAVAARSGDGTAGLPAHKDSSLAGTRKEIERFADIIFSAVPNDRKFWLGEKAGNDREFIEREFRSLKPCLHGSDAHSIAKMDADLDRFCWIKGDPTFETLRQAVLEPKDRVWIGPSLPEHLIASHNIKAIELLETPWLTNKALNLNSGLIAIIGARGSGKTALADIIARAAGVDSLSDDSFLTRASDLLGDGQVRLLWKDDSSDVRWLGDWNVESEAGPEVRYLSQHFVESLCSARGLAVELRREMEGVIFDSTDSTERMGAEDFDELSRISLGPIGENRYELQQTILEISDAIVREDVLHDGLNLLEKDLEALQRKIAVDKAEQKRLLPKDSELKVAQLAKLEAACAEREAVIERLRLKKKVASDLNDAVHRIRAITEPQRLANMQQQYFQANLSEEQWGSFGMAFVGEVDQILNEAQILVEKEIDEITNGDASQTIDLSKQPLGAWPLNPLKVARDKLKVDVGLDITRRQKYEALQKAIGLQESSLKKAEEKLQTAKGAAARKTQLITRRRQTYSEVFQTFDQERAVLERLYSPLRGRLVDQKGALKKLGFTARRYVDLAKWVQDGELLLDLRKGSEFQGHGSLKAKAVELLEKAWAVGSAEEVTSSMDNFRTTYWREFLKAIPNGVEDIKTWQQSIASWLYDTSHITIGYNIEYEGVPIEQLSPGTRGIVLLLLYLAIDVRDRRPLIIDQPEENLDPNSVFEELVPHFREARQRRQVIIVTHNANLVVNTDADQVVVANAVRTVDGGLPIITYVSGAIENNAIRRAICGTLEGGERAFLDREKRYRLRWMDQTELVNEVQSISSTNNS